MAKRGGLSGSVSQLRVEGMGFRVCFTQAFSEHVGEMEASDAVGVACAQRSKGCSGGTLKPTQCSVQGCTWGGGSIIMIMKKQAQTSFENSLKHSRARTKQKTVMPKPAPT